MPPKGLKMNYSNLKHKLRFSLLSRFVEKGPFHIKELSLCCLKSREFIKGDSQRGYRELIIDIKKTEEKGIPCGAYYNGGYWEFDIWLDDIGYCKKCYKNLLEYVRKELAVSKTEKVKLIKSNAQEIQRLISNQLDKYNTKA
jgi:hypothetical protein